MKTLRLLTVLSALTLTAPTAHAAVLDLSNVLGPSGRYSNQAYYQTLLGGQPMTSAQQAYSDLQDQLRSMGYLWETRGDFAIGQIFYSIAYGIIPPSPPSSLDLPSGENDLHPPSGTPGGLGSGASDDTGSSSSVLTLGNSTGDDLTGTAVVAAPEATSWAMMLLGFAGLGFLGWRGRESPLRAGLSRRPLVYGTSSTALSTNCPP